MHLISPMVQNVAPKTQLQCGRTIRLVRYLDATVARTCVLPTLVLSDALGIRDARLAQQLGNAGLVERQHRVGLDHYHEGVPGFLVGHSVGACGVGVPSASRREDRDTPFAGESGMI